MKKKIYVTGLTMFLCLAAFSSHAATFTSRKAAKEAIANMTVEQKQARIEEIKQRVEDIKAMDKSQLTRAERRDLRDELKSDRMEASAMSGGIYLSVGAIIIIILLLILLL
jgi:hypothetical protein